MKVSVKRVHRVMFKSKHRQLALLKGLVAQEPEKPNALAGNLYHIAKLIVFSQANCL